ncbi:MAG: hypothetical protein KGD59_07390 [Candidatus Heimdallarchaeota archaeon]|nr:hypothetical protein [Candidatus Heimdallarchaeota archaeon]MBY8994358.1 hypothetical protein [Candidatus Heimdallarchaeota archaeon]
MRKRTFVLTICTLMFIFIAPMMHIIVDGKFEKNNFNFGFVPKKVINDDSILTEKIDTTRKEEYLDQEKQLTSNMFIENKGQFDQELMFYTKVSETGIGFASSKIIFYLKGTKFSINFVGANSVKPTGNQFLKSYSNYYTSDFVLNKVKHCTQVFYENLYDGIHLIYKFTEMGLKYDFILEPFADVSLIQVEYLGLDSIEVESNKLILSKTNNIIVDDQLVAWYEDTKEELSVSFSKCKIEESGNYKQLVSFEIEDYYDYSRQIIIDPLICIYSTFFGGSFTENPIAGADLGEKDLIVDEFGNILIVGRTSSSDFPTANATQGTKSDGYDVIVSKLTPDAQSLVFSSFLGGTYDEWATDVAVDSNGNVAIVGLTESGNFPVLNAIQATHNGGSEEDPNDIFVVKLNKYGTMLFSTFWGGKLDDWAYGVEFDSSGNIVIAGGSSSADYYTVNAHQEDHSPGSNGDIIITKFASDGQSVLFSTFLGGSGFESARAVEIDSANNILITGATQGTTFPTYNAYQSSVEGTTACVVAKFSSSGVLQFATTLDGMGIESGYGITSDDQNNVIVGGSTTSVNFPIANATQTPIGGGLDAFITKFAADGQSLLYSSFIGGTGGDECRDIELDKNGKFLAVGHTTSLDFPIRHAYQYYYSGNYDVFITLIDPNSTLISSSYLGGSHQDQAIGAGVDPSNNIVVGGFTLSNNFPILNAYQSSISGVNDLFISKFELDLTLPDITPPNPTPTTPPTNEGTGMTFAVLFVIISLIGGSIVINRKRKLMINEE